MKLLPLEYRRPLLIALLIHVVLIAILFMSFDWHYQPPIVNKGEKIVHAVAVDEQEVQKLVKNLKKEEEQKRKEEIAHQDHLEKLAADAKRKRLLEQERVKDLQKKKADLEEQRKAQVKKLAQEKDMEKKALAKLKQQQQEQDKQLKALQKQQAEAQEKLTKLKKENSDNAKLKKQHDEALALQKKIAEKQQAIAKEKSEAITGVVNKYKGLILEAISQNWLVPPGTNPNLSCKLYIELEASGKVASVKVIKSSGNSLLDRSAVAAVYKASPLPAPEDASAYQAFKQFSLTVTPVNIIEVH